MMRRTSLVQGVLTLCVLVASSAHAQNVRSWVASLGLDSNDCTRNSPCRTFARAMETTNLNGEVVVLDSAGYGQFSIDKAISIISPAGIQAAIAPTAGSAITIEDGITGPVVLRGLYLNGQGASTGIENLSDTRVHIESCVVNGFDEGIVAPADVLSQLLISDCAIRNNQSNGILWQSSGRAVIQNCRLEGNGSAGLIVFAGMVTARDTVAAENGDGFVADTAGRLDVIDCAASNNVTAGFRVFSNSDIAIIHIESSLSSGNLYGLFAGAITGGAAIRVSHSVIINNSFGAFLNGVPSALILSAGNNTLEANVEGNTFGATYNQK